jgi:hypothetical protein
VRFLRPRRRALSAANAAGVLTRLKLGGESKARPRARTGEPEDRWCALVDAPRVLSDLFWEHAATEYNKTTHSAALTQWLLANITNLNICKSFLTMLLASLTQTNDLWSGPVGRIERF